MPEVDVQSMLHQHEVPIVNDAYRSPLLMPIFVLKNAQTRMHRLSHLAVQLWMKFVQTSQHASRLPKEFCRRAAGFALARNCSGCYPDRESRKSFRPLKPLFKDCQSRQTYTSVIVNLFDYVRELFGNVGAHHSPANLVSRPTRLIPQGIAVSPSNLIGMGGQAISCSSALRAMFFIVDSVRAFRAQVLSMRESTLYPPGGAYDAPLNRRARRIRPVLRQN